MTTDFFWTGVFKQTQHRKPYNLREWRRNAAEKVKGGKCSKCGATTDLTGGHRRPGSAGGGAERSNIVVLCRSCNGREGAERQHGVSKHLQGQHDQKTHGRGGAGLSLDSSVEDISQALVERYGTIDDPELGYSGKSYLLPDGRFVPLEYPGHHEVQMAELFYDEDRLMSDEGDQLVEHTLTTTLDKGIIRVATAKNGQLGVEARAPITSSQRRALLRWSPYGLLVNDFGWDEGFKGLVRDRSSVIDAYHAKLAHRDVAKHLGPGPHATGTTQEAHAGGLRGPTVGEAPVAGGEPDVDVFPSGIDPSKPFLSSWPPGSQAKLTDALQKKLDTYWEDMTDEEVFERIVETHLGLIDRARARGPEVHDAFKNWYRTAHTQCHEAAQRLVVDPNEFMAIAAALSAQGDWDTKGKRLGTFDSALAQIAALKADARFADVNTPITDELMAALPNTPTANADMRTKLIRLWRGESPDIVLRGDNGWKVRNFYNNILAPDRNAGVTIDRHAIRASINNPEMPEEAPKGTLTIVKLLGGPGKTKAGMSLASYLYPLFADAIWEAGRRRGLRPHEAQAVSWEQWRDEHPPKRR